MICLSMPKHDIALLEAALIGFEARVEEINGKMAEIRAQLGGKTVGNVPSAAPRKRRRMSSAGRRNIIAATKKR